MPVFDKPFDLLNNFVEEKIKIKRTDGTIVKGTLQAFDQHQNFALTNAKVYDSSNVDDESVDAVEYPEFFQRGSSVKDVRPVMDGGEQVE